MKEKYFVLIIFIIVGLSLNARQDKLSDKQFYYYKGEKTYLQIDFSRIAVISNRKFNRDNVMKRNNLPVFKVKNEGRSYTRQNVIPINDVPRTMLNEEIFITELKFTESLEPIDYFEFIQRFSRENNIIQVAPAFSSSNQNLGVSNNFYVKLFKKDDLNSLLSLAEKYSIQILGYNEFMPLWFTLSCGRETPFSTIEAANLFFETKLFECAEPELLYHNLPASNDTYFSNQWGLKNIGQYGGYVGLDINAEQAWELSKGEDVVVAVFDQGFEMDHPDLFNNNYGTGYDAATNTTPARVRGKHGTVCAGIIGVQQNNARGISGVAPHSRLMSISIGGYYSDTPQQLANGFNWAWRNGADIISNSWGFIPDDWSYAPSTFLEEAIDSTLTYGRNGKGTILVFASGNENNTDIRYPGNSRSDILVVGAISPCGERKSRSSCDGEAWGSNYGMALDIAAPGVLIPTTDQQGYPGYNPDKPDIRTHPEIGGNKVTSDYANQDYTVWFNGTSSACPHVAGVAALVLSVNPTLTGQQVRDMIESTAQKVGGYNYRLTPNRLNGTWHEETGYGLVDAYAAVKKASCTVYFTNQTVSTDTYVTSCGDINVENVKVRNGAKLILDAAGEVNIIRNFEVDSGSEFEIE